MAKRSTNFNRWRKTGTTRDVADLMQRYGVTADDLRAYQRQRMGTSRRRGVCPRCGATIETEVYNYDGSCTCPACENEINLA